MLVLGDTRNGLKFILWFLFDTKKTWSENLFFSNFSRLFKSDVGRNSFSEILSISSLTVI